MGPLVFEGIFDGSGDAMDVDHQTLCLSLDIRGWGDLRMLAGKRFRLEVLD